MEMPKVAKCEVDDCAYNVDDVCHAMAITIGDGTRPRCDTFCRSMTKGGDAGCIAGVGACKVSACMYNANLECQSPEVNVGYNEDEPDCLTFKVM